MTLDIFKQYATDDMKENDGVWTDIGGGAKLLIARAGNRAYSKLLTSLVEKNQRVLDSKTDAAGALSDQIMIDVAAQTILLDWESIEFKGEKQAYTVDNAKKLLGVKDFRKLVGKLADDVEAYRVADEDAVAKN